MNGYNTSTHVTSCDVSSTDLGKRICSCHLLTYFPPSLLALLHVNKARGCVSYPICLFRTPSWNSFPFLGCAELSDMTSMNADTRGLYARMSHPTSVVVVVKNWGRYLPKQRKKL